MSIKCNYPTTTYSCYLPICSVPRWSGRPKRALLFFSDSTLFSTIPNAAVAVRSCPPWTQQAKRRITLSSQGRKRKKYTNPLLPQLLLLLHLTTRSRRHGCTITRRNAQNERTDERFRNMIYSVWGSGFLSLQLILTVLNLLLFFPFFQHLINLLPSIPNLPACLLLGLPVYVCTYATWCSRLNALATFCERLMHPNIKQPLSLLVFLCARMAASRAELVSILTNLKMTSRSRFTYKTYRTSI